MARQNIEPICEVADDCLECPLSRCRYDDPAWFQSLRQNRRALAVFFAMGGDGLDVRQMADRLGVTKRTVYRIRESARSLARRETDADLRVFARLFTSTQR